MPDADEIASAHDALVDLLLDVPRESLMGLMFRAAGLDPVDVVEVRERTPALELPGARRRAGRIIVDLVLSAHRSDGRTIVIMVVECQLTWDAYKRWVWAAAPGGFALRSGAEARVVVLCPDPDLRARLRDKLLPKIVPRPILVEPDQIELITDEHEARRRPYETILGSVYHAREDLPVHERVAGIRAALLATKTLDSIRRARYTVLMLKVASQELIRRALDEMEARGESADVHEEISDIERGGFLYNHLRDLAHADGLRRGREEGLEEGREERARLLRRAVVDVLELREFEVTPAALDRVHSTDDPEQLERWYARARRVPTDTPLEQIFELGGADG